MNVSHCMMWGKKRPRHYNDIHLSNEIKLEFFNEKFKITP
jgi:hypothetical protein